MKASLIEVGYKFQCSGTDTSCLCNPGTQELLTKGRSRFTKKQIMQIREMACSCKTEEVVPKPTPKPNPRVPPVDIVVPPVEIEIVQSNCPAKPTPEKYS